MISNWVPNKGISLIPGPNCILFFLFVPLLGFISISRLGVGQGDHKLHVQVNAKRPGSRIAISGANQKPMREIHKWPIGPEETNQDVSGEISPRAFNLYFKCFLMKISIF